MSSPETLAKALDNLSAAVLKLDRAIAGEFRKALLNLRKVRPRAFME